MKVLKIQRGGRQKKENVSEKGAADEKKEKGVEWRLWGRTEEDPYPRPAEKIKTGNRQSE